MLAFRNTKLYCRVISNCLKGSNSIRMTYSTSLLSSAPLNINSYLSKRTNVSMLQSQVYIILFHLYFV
jgi:hypothetical protein